MDGICCAILNSTFQRLQTQMLQRFQSIKAKMPRRESARRNHPLACESDIIETLHMRLTLLQMTFGKHIERKHCCFFAGEVGFVSMHIGQSRVITQKGKMQEQKYLIMDHHCTVYVAGPLLSIVTQCTNGSL
jgi:F-box protein 28